MKKNSKKKQVLLTLVAIISLIVITVGVTYAFFNYAKEGTTDNTIQTGTITFLYTEVSGVGKGISLTDAYPVADSVGKVQVGEGKIFDFKVTSNISMNSNIGYQVTARKKTGSTLANSAVKVYLTEVNGTEQELLLSKYSELDQTDKVDSSKYDERILYEATVPANTSNYEKNFRLRMWVSDDTDFSDGSMNDKTFTLTLNVYANGKVVTLPANTVYTFDYTGDEQTFEVPATGIYKLETWGASGGNVTNTYYGGYGSYSSGIINLQKRDKLYINVGGKGNSDTSSGGYNGGGSSKDCPSNGRYAASGGGATHIAIISGLLSTLESNKDTILLVSGGGGGAFVINVSGDSSVGNGSNAGGYIGNTVSFVNTGSHQKYLYATGGTQLIGGTSGNSYNDYLNGTGTFGKADSITLGTFCDGNDGSGGGGGFYGGGAGFLSPGAGGSGYIGNPLLTDKVMYCYNCNESSEESTKTISITNVSEEAISNYAKIGNGYARITYLGES